MKSLNLVTAIALAAALLGVGCKHRPVNVTQIPRVNDGAVSDSGGTPITKLPPGTNTRPTTDRSNPLPGDTGNGSRDLGNNPNADTTSKPLSPDELAKANQQGSRPDMDKFNEDAAMFAAEAVHFDYDRSTVKSSEVPHVQRVAAYMKNETSVSLRVEGNCDERGTEEYNRSLGERRALAVRELLVAAGIAPDRVTTVTYGEDKPVDPGHDETAWGKNRRADFVVLRPKTLQ